MHTYNNINTHTLESISLVLLRGEITESLQLLILLLLPPKGYVPSHIAQSLGPESSVGTYERDGFLKSMQHVSQSSLQECKPSIMGHNCNPKTAEVKTGVTPVQDQPQLHEILPYLKKTNKQKTDPFKNNKNKHKTKSSQFIIDSEANKMFLPSQLISRHIIKIDIFQMSLKLATYLMRIKMKINDFYQVIMLRPKSFFLKYLPVILLISQI